MVVGRGFYTCFFSLFTAQGHGLRRPVGDETQLHILLAKPTALGQDYVHLEEGVPFFDSHKDFAAGLSEK